MVDKYYDWYRSRGNYKGLKMKDQFAVRLRTKEGETLKDTGWVLLVDGKCFTDEPLKVFSESKTYPRQSLVIYNDIIYRAILPVPGGLWNKDYWERVDNAFAVINPYERINSYPEDSMVLNAKQELLYSVSPVGIGEQEKFINAEHGTDIMSAFVYVSDDLEGEAIQVKGKLAKIYRANRTVLNPPTGELEDPELPYKDELTESLIAYYDPRQLFTLRKTMIEGDVPQEFERVAFVRDLSGNGNHAIQLDAQKRPTLRKNPQGQWYLRFDPGQYLETKYSTIGKAHHYLNIAGAGVPHFITTNEGKIRVGMKSTSLERFWAWGGEAIVKFDQEQSVLDTVRAKQMTLCKEYAPLTQGTFYNMFKNEVDLVDGMADFDISGIDNVTGLFHGCRNFNEDLSGWDTSHWVNARFVFQEALKFNNGSEPGMSDRPLTWDMSNCTTMLNMFTKAISFNQPLPWNTQNVESMNSMFRFCDVFNQDISGWNTGSVIDFNFMFDRTPVFDQPIGSWDTSSALTMEGMMANMDSFDQDISTWCVVQIPVRPPHFANHGAIEYTAKEPRWGEPC